MHATYVYTCIVHCLYTIIYMYIYRKAREPKCLRDQYISYHIRVQAKYYPVPGRLQQRVPRTIQVTFTLNTAP
jgi:hypothetical protein